LIVIDASVMIAWLINEPHLALSEDIYQLLAEEPIRVPAHWPVEVGNALSVNMRRGRITPDRLSAITGRLAHLDIVVEPAGTPDTIVPLIRFAADNGLTCYDAAYVLLARNAEGALATVDTDMRRAAQRLAIPLLPD
jgi:predicted nucleic acid-binding protein